MQDKKKKIILICTFVIFLIIIEQVIKAIIPKQEKLVLIQNVLNVSYVENRGAAFGIGNNDTITFIIISIIIISMVVRFLLTQLERLDRFVLISLVLILAGGVGNLMKGNFFFPND